MFYNNSVTVNVINTPQGYQINKPNQYYILKIFVNLSVFLIPSDVILVIKSAFAFMYIK